MLDCLSKEVSDTCSAYSDKHFDKVGTTQAEERDSRFSSHSLGEQGLASPGLTHEQGPLGNLSPQPPIPFRILEEVHNLHEFGPCLIYSGHIVKSDTGAPLHVYFCLALADSHEPTLGPHTVHYERPQAEEN